MAIKGSVIVVKNKGKYNTLNIYRYEGVLYVEIYDGDMRKEQCFLSYCRAFKDYTEIKNWLLLVEELPESTADRIISDTKERI